MTAYLLAIELCLACIAIAAAYTVPDFARQHLPGVEHLLAPLVKRPRLAVIVIGLSALAARAAVRFLGFMTNSATCWLPIRSPTDV